MRDLKHYGVLGMRWGVRRANGGSRVTVGPGVRGKAREVGGLLKDAAKDDLSKAKSVVSKIKSFGAKQAEKAKPSKDFTIAKQLKRKPIAKLSNEELKTVINRLQLEKQFNDLNKGTVDKGKGIVSRILGNLVAKSVNAFVSQKAGPDYASYQTFADAIKNKANRG